MSTSLRILVILVALSLPLVALAQQPMEWVERDVTIPAATTIVDNQHPTDRWITVAAGSAEYRDAHGTRQVRAGDQIFIPAQATHSLTVGQHGITMHAVGLTVRGEPLHTCSGGM